MARGRDASSGFPPPLKRLGQHFLSDPRILDRIVDALALEGHETVVEIGPGRGGLTDRLITRAARVVVIEIDRALAALLRTRYENARSVQVVERDALAVSLAAAAAGDVDGSGELTTGRADAMSADAGGSPHHTNASPDTPENSARTVTDFVVTGNVPYYITTPLLFHSLVPPRPSRSVFLVQREVAERIVAPAGSEHYGALSANVQALANARMMFRVPPGAFQPPPKVDSAVIRITGLSNPLIRRDEEVPFRKLVQGAFGLRRKQMRNVLRTLTGLTAPEAEAVLEAAGVAPDVRPETLGPERFAAILRALRARGEGVEIPPGVTPDS